MSTSRNNYDAIEKIIFDEGLSIKYVEIKPDINKMLIFLSTDHIIALPLSLYKNLKNASLEGLQQFELFANGTGIRWPKLDEDLSLKGFLKDALYQMVTDRQLIVA